MLYRQNYFCTSFILYFVQMLLLHCCYWNMSYLSRPQPFPESLYMGDSDVTLTTTVTAALLESHRVANSAVQRRKFTCARHSCMWNYTSVEISTAWSWKWTHYAVSAQSHY